MMVSMSQIVDPDLSPADLSTLGSRLALPDGWTYQARRRITDLVLKAEGEAIMLQDDLKNTYQRTTISATPSSTLPVLDDGTGTVCSSDTDCQGLDAAHCLQSAGQGFCTIEGCVGGECGVPYVCCYGCSAAVAPMLPFEGSACIPEAASEMLTTQASCTCD
jgi:hypothetical protein